MDSSWDWSGSKSETGDPVEVGMHAFCYVLCGGRRIRRGCTRGSTSRCLDALQRRSEWIVGLQSGERGLGKGVFRGDTIDVCYDDWIGLIIRS
jgi:hypothetical protein